jgi:hypothetical protein
MSVLHAILHSEYCERKNKGTKKIILPPALLMYIVSESVKEIGMN